MSEPGDTTGTKPPFERTDLVDKPGIVGARWWQASLADETSQVERRSAIKSIVVAAGVLAGFGEIVSMCASLSSSSSSSSSSDVDTSEQRKTSLDVQKDYGWSFGAYDEPLVFDGASLQPFDPATLPKLVEAMRPQRLDLRRYYLPTLFDAPEAQPKERAQIDPGQLALFKPLAQSIKPIRTPAMELAYRKGRSLASIVAGAKDTTTALVIDLPGPEAVAFAAGAASVFDPVMLFDNWPHPRGVVPAHTTLGAALFYQPLFDKERSATPPAGKGKPPAFVLDRRRLAAYADDASQFDNRFVAKLPSPAAAMSLLGIANVLYVVPTEADAKTELDDLNDDFLLYTSANLDVRAVSLDLFQQMANAAAAPMALDAGLPNVDDVWYGGSPTSHGSFYLDYPWAKPPFSPKQRVASNVGKTYRPAPRTTPYSTGSASGSIVKQRPTSFATVPVLVAVGTGVVLGARYTRNGSWNRSSGGWSS